MRTLSRFVVVGMIGGVASACNSDTTRFASNPFDNLFSTGSATTGEPTMTGSVPSRASEERRGIRPPQDVPDGAAPVQPEPMTAAPRVAAPVTSSPLPAPPAPITRAPVASQAPTGGPAGWTTQRGTPIIVRQGDTLNAIATRYGVPASAILSANKLKSAAQVTPGKQIVIPVYNATGAPESASAVSPKGRHVEEKPATKDRHAAKVDSKAKGAKPEPQKPVAQKIEPPKPAKPEKVAAVPAAAVKPAEAPKPEVAKAPAKEPEQTASIAAPQAYAPVAPAGPSFRWPAKGRVIAGFGANGNEGINIAVPEGTPVKAAEDGTVAYAGSDVKGYGKLVLVRHDNGYVSAYAHNGEIAVKHGEKVKRGQVIAKSGQSGNVTSPQLHFEIRKGASPMDPMPHLSGG